MSHSASFWPSPRVGRRGRALAGVALAVLVLHAGFFSALSGDDPVPRADAVTPPRPPVALRVRELAAPAPGAPAGPDAMNPVPSRALPVGTRAARIIGSTVPAAPPAAAAADRLLGEPVAPASDAPAAVGGPPPDASAQVDALPIYPTRPAPALAYVYDLQRGAERGTLTLRWRPDGTRYEASLSATLADAPLFDLRSSGAFDAAGLAPQRHTDRRRGRSPQAANFRRDDGRITFSGAETERALAPGTQDGLSWMLQLAAIVAADPALAAPGGQIRLAVADVRGEADRWTFTHQADETLILADGSQVRTARLVRLPARPYDTRAEVWLDPARHYLPLRARLSNPPSGRGALVMDWRDALAPP